MGVWIDGGKLKPNRSNWEIKLEDAAGKREVLVKGLESVPVVGEINVRGSTGHRYGELPPFNITMMKMFDYSRIIYLEPENKFTLDKLIELKFMKIVYDVENLQGEDRHAFFRVYERTEKGKSTNEAKSFGYGHVDAKNGENEIIIRINEDWVRSDDGLFGQFYFHFNQNYWREYSRLYYPQFEDFKDYFTIKVDQDQTGRVQYYRPYFKNDKQFCEETIPTVNLGTKAPRIFYYFEYQEPSVPKSLNPNNIIEDPSKDIEFTWNIETLQSKFELEYKVDDGNWIRVAKSSILTGYTLPAGTIKQSTGDVSWRVRYAIKKEEKYDDGQDTWSEWSNGQFRLGIPEPVEPRVISPNGNYYFGGDKLTFEWVFSSNSIETQKAYELEYWIGENKYTLSGNEEAKKTIQLDEINSTKGSWKIRTKDSYGRWSPWSEEAYFQIIARTRSPIIDSISPENYPLIKWNSFEQTFYSIKIINEDGENVYDTGEIIGMGNEHRVKSNLAPGRYKLETYIGSVYGHRSNIVEYYFQVEENEELEVPDVRIYEEEYYITVTSNLDGIVIKDGQEIGETANGIFRDYTTANSKNYDYQIRVIENYWSKDSKTVSGRLYFDANTIASASNLKDYVRLKWNLGEKPPRERSFVIQQEEYQIDGKKYPSYEFGVSKQDQRSYTFSVKEEEIDRLIEILEAREDVLFRDYYGVNIVGNISGYNINKVSPKYYQVTFTIVRTSDEYD